MRTVFLRVIEAEDKATALRAVAREPDQEPGRRFEVPPKSFAAVPRSPFAYWVSERLRRLFRSLPRFEGEGRTVKQGLATTNDFRFLRAWWAIPHAMFGTRWFPFAKGGPYSPFYSDLSLCVDWRSNGAQSWAIYYARRDVVGGIIKNPEFYFRPGLTWPIKNRFPLKPWPLAAGSVFAHVGPSAFVEGNGAEQLAELHALMSSIAFTALVRISAGWNYEVGVIQHSPLPRSSPAGRSALAALARRAWSLKRSLDTRTETSHAFALPALLQVSAPDLPSRAAAWSDRVRTVEAELAAIQSEIDDRCFDLYGIDEADRRAITEGFGVTSADADATDVPDADDTPDDADDPVATADSATLAAELVSWAAGVAFGRFDVRLATGARPLPTGPEPFDPLPVCSPGMLTGEDGLPLARPPAGYPLAFPESGILLDDPGHSQDLTAAVRAVVEVVFGADADRWWHELAATLGDPHDLRGWFATSFFEHHLKRYSKSRRKAPILWQLAIPSRRYAIWLYAHRLTSDTFFRLLGDHLAPKLAHEERKLTALVQEAKGSPTASQRRELDAQQSLVEELRAFREEVARVAPLWNPDLDDGVIINFAPLWRLVPQHRAWQKECKACWDKLVAGDYDWAHLAMHLFPERVVPKCADDRSLAIAHGLEETFWVETDGKWKKREVDAAVVKRLVTDRIKPAVKEALRSLLEAPVSGPTRSSKATGRARARKGKTP